MSKTCIRNRSNTGMIWEPHVRLGTPPESLQQTVIQPGEGIKVKHKDFEKVVSRAEFRVYPKTCDQGRGFKMGVIAGQEIKEMKEIEIQYQPASTDNGLGNVQLNFQ